MGIQFELLVSAQLYMEEARSIIGHKLQNICSQIQDIICYKTLQSNKIDQDIET